MNKRAMKQDDADEGLEIEVVDDVPEDEKPRTATRETDQADFDADDSDDADDADDTDDSDDTDDDDLEGYSGRVQKRLKKLTFKYREAERKESEAARMRDEAVKYAQQVAEENKRLRSNVEQGQGAYVEQAKARAIAEVDRAKRQFKEAYEAGEAADLAEAQEALTKAQHDLYRFENYRPRPVQSSVPERDFSQPQPQPQTQEAPQLDPLQREWMTENPWFGKNKAMTGYAYGVHEQLVESGVDPNTRTYYTQINKAMRARFADELGGGDDGDVEEVRPAPAKRKANVVAPAQRSTKQPRQVKLTATAAALAKRLGLSNEEYAAQMLKDAKNGR